MGVSRLFTSRVLIKRIPIPCLSTWASPVMPPEAFLSELAEPAAVLNVPTPETPIPLIPVGLPVRADFLSQRHSLQPAPHSAVSFFHLSHCDANLCIQSGIGELFYRNNATGNSAQRVV